MPNTISRGAEYKRQFAYEKPVQFLIDWLNGPSQDIARNRISALLRDLRIVLISWEFIPDEKIWGVQKDKGMEYKKSLRRVNQLFRQYTFSIEVNPFGSVALRAFRPISGPDGKAKGWGLAPGEYSDFDAIWLLSMLIEVPDSPVRRIFECPQCGRWMYARFSHQRFCSGKCREREFKSSDEWKAKRRDKAREYYRLHKKANVK